MSESQEAVAPPVDLSEAYAALRRRARQVWRRRIVVALAAILVVAGSGVAAVTIWVGTIGVPAAPSLSETTTVYFSDGRTVMARLGEQNRVLVQLAGLPKHAPAAVVAAVDPGFWSGSATRISRQYARLATGANASGVTGRARVVVMARRLEETHSKEQILEFFLNTAYFGRRAYGIGAASRAYFGKPAEELDLAEAVVLAGVIDSPGDGRFDPTVNPGGARKRFNDVRESMVALGAIDARAAAALRLPRVAAEDPAATQSRLERPTGLVVAHALAELRRSEMFSGRPAGYLENGGFAIVTTVDARAQALLERISDERVIGSVMHGQTGNLQAAAVVVEPGTGRVIAYYGGQDGTGADYAGWYLDATGTPVGYGAHPPGQTFNVYTLAAALEAGISLESRWESPASKVYPASGRGTDNPVRDFNRAPCQPTCTLADAAAASLRVPFVAVTERLGATVVWDVARDAGIDSMWIPENGQEPRQRIDLRGLAATAVGPVPFTSEVSLGKYPVTVLDHANGMATLAAEGVRAEAHFVREVSKGGTRLYGERPSAAGEAPVLSKTAVDDLTWALAHNPAGRLADGRPCAFVTGEWDLGTNAVDTAHAWAVGFTRNLAMAVWIGNEEFELPLVDLTGARVGGGSLPTRIFTTFMSQVHARLNLKRIEFGSPTFTGDPTVGNAVPPPP